MKSNILKEKNRRKLYNKIENKYFIKKGFTFINKNENFDIAKNHFIKNFKTPQKANKVKIFNRCIFSGRPRSVFQKFKISRSFLRTKASYGLINGLSKTS